MKERLKNNKGFTLVEIIVVLVILAILAAIAVPSVIGYVDEAKKTRYIEEAHSIYTVIQTEEARYKALDNELNDDSYNNEEYRNGLIETIKKQTGIQDVTFGKCSHIGKDNAEYNVNFKSDDRKFIHAVIKKNKDIEVNVFEN